MDYNKVTTKVTKISQDWSRTLSELSVENGLKQAFIGKVKGRTRVCLLDNENNLVLVGKDSKPEEIIALGTSEISRFKSQ